MLDFGLEFWDAGALGPGGATMAPPRLGQGTVAQLGLRKENRAWPLDLEYVTTIRFCGLNRSTP